MDSSFKLGRIRGIEIGIHSSWLIVFVLVTWSLAAGFFPANYPDWAPATYWAVGVISALALFASVLVHELSHSFVARARGIAVRGITLFLFGGVSNLQGEAARPKDEFLITIVGPLTSFAIAAVCWGLVQVLPASTAPPVAILSYLALINTLLGGFNLVPAFPLDGGRVLRSILWGMTGSLRRATAIASAIGQGFGFLLIFWGIGQVLAGDFLSGLWIAFMGWFLNGAAEASRRGQALEESLRGVRVADVMNPQPPTGDPHLSVATFVFDHVLHQGQRALLVMDADRLLGIVSLTDAKHLPQTAWATTPITAIMTPAPLKTIAPEAELRSALQQMMDGTLNQLPVVIGGRVVGILSRTDLLRFLQLHEELDLPREQARERRSGQETVTPDR